MSVGKDKGIPVPARGEGGDIAFRLRLMTAADIPAGLKLCRAARWNQIEADWRRFLALHPAGARVAVDAHGAVIGSVATLRFGGGVDGFDGFDWLAMVLVLPEYRRQGIASRLVEAAIEQLGARAPVRLDATPAGELVYRNLAFVPEYALARMERPANGSTESLNGNGVRAMENEDLAEILQLDRKVFGADRSALLWMLKQDAPAYALVARGDSSRLEGYVFGRHGFSFDQLGPIVARDEGAARRLVGHIVASNPSVAFLVDVPRQSARWVAWLGEIGFREQRGFVRLVRGAPAGRESTSSEPRLFATIGADFG